MKLLRETRVVWRKLVKIRRVFRNENGKFIRVNGKHVNEMNGIASGREVGE
jgi:hypothetical protein